MIARVISEDIVKNAKMDPDKLNRLLKILAAVTAAGAVASPIASHFVGGAVQKHKEQKEMDKSWQRIIARNPEMNNEDIRETFESLYDLSPSIMKHPKFALPALRTTGAYDTGGIPVELASKLVNIDASRTKGSPDLNTKLLTGLSTGVNIMRGMGDISTGEKERKYRQSLDAEKAKRDQQKLLIDYSKMTPTQRQEFDTRGGVI